MKSCTWAGVLCIGVVSAAALTAQGETAAIVVGQGASPAEHYAATQLAHYLDAAFGLDAPIVNPGTAETPSWLFVVGSPATNALLDEFVRQGLLKLSADYPGSDGFIIKTLTQSDKRYCIIGSIEPRGCVYGVFHFAEQYLHVGFFWDGDSVPPKRPFALDAIDVAEKPYFPVREYIQSCVFGYTTQFWGLDHWKKELEWAAKKKFNLIHLPGATEIPMRRVMKRLDVEMPEPAAPWYDSEAELWRNVHAYARSLGLRTVLPAFGGVVPAQCKEKYPAARYIEVKWLDFPPTLNLFPSDPLFKKVAALFAEECINAFGTDHYYNVDPYPECDPGSSPEEKRQIKVDFAAATAETLLAADPKATWVCSGWAFMGWAKEDVAAFLQPIPADHYIVNDIWAEANPLHQKLDYFFGKQWGFGVLHSMGGWTTLHGDLKDLGARVQAVSQDPAARNCVNFYLNPEIIHHNDVYFDLAARLAWNPADVNLEHYLDDYCSRRYGRSSCPGMRAAWAELLQSVYGHCDYTRPLYWDRPLFTNVPESIETLRRFYIPHLECALERALAEAHDLAGNPFYLRDVVDITRQYAAEIYNVHMAKLNAAFRAKDREAFERHAGVLGQCLDSVEEILSSHEAFYVAPEIAMARRLPPFQGNYLYAAAKDNGEIVRQRYTALGGVNTMTLLDYAAKDMYELVKFYYRGRSDAYIQHLREKLAAGQEVSTEELEAAYHKIVAAFVATPFENYGVPASTYLGNPVRAAREILLELRDSRDLLDDK